MTHHLYQLHSRTAATRRTSQKIVDAFEDENPDITVEVTTLPYADYFTALQTDARRRHRERRVRHRVRRTTRCTRRTACSRRSTSANPDAYQAVAARGVLDRRHLSTRCRARSRTSSCSTTRTCSTRPASTYPTADWTWADEKAAAEALTDTAAGVWGDHQPVSFYEFYKVLAQNGGEFLAADGKSVAFNSPEGIEAAEVARRARAAP